MKMKQIRSVTAREALAVARTERWAGVDDGDFTDPYVDVDEWRTEPVRHRYVHGGFTGTDVRFSCYFPPADRYEGRFFQHVTPVPDSEHLAQQGRGEDDKVGFSVASGGYFVETNGGGVSGTPGSSVDPTIAAYRANGAAAQHSRVIAAAMYGEHRPYGYLYGGSGGGYRTMGSAENTTGVWDGFVPYVIGSPMAIPNMFTVRMHAQRILRGRFEAIVDALDAGGSGDPYAGLDGEERAALVEVTRMGFPPRSWFGWRTMGMHAFPVLYGGVRMADPSYFEEFWTEPGYLGQAMPPSLRRDVVQVATEIAALVTDEDAERLGLDHGHQPGQARGGVDTAWKGAGATPAAVVVGVRLATAPGVDFEGADLEVRSGASAGARLSVLRVAGDVVGFGPGDGAVIAAIASLRPGDAVDLDNRGFLAAQTYHRHQVPTPDFTVWDQFRDADGAPMYPQRPLLLGPLFTAAASGTVQTGAIEGKMIVVSCLLDREAVPWQADWYRTKVQEHLGAALDDCFRLWYVDRALHGDVAAQEHPTQSVSYVGVLQQALRDLSAWVERGVAPPPSTSYDVDDGQVIVPTTARARGGVQPVVTLTADGVARAGVRAGDEVVLRVEVEVPPGTGHIVAVEWDLDGSATYATPETVAPQPRVELERRHRFTQPGTHFVTVRVASQRDGDPSTPFARLSNLARTRVVVS